MSPWSREKYIRAYRFAAEAHRDQTVRGSDRPYIAHPTLVAMEVIAVLSMEKGWDADLVVQCALLHDVLEDTDRKAGEIEQLFGKAVTDGVLALTKDISVGDRRAQLIENLERILRQPWEIWMVKLADRIANLQPPPKDWTPERIDAYREESRLIHRTLGKANPSLALRLAKRINTYPKGLPFLPGATILASPR